MFQNVGHGVKPIKIESILLTVFVAKIKIWAQLSSGGRAVVL